MVHTILRINKTIIYFLIGLLTIIFHSYIIEKELVYLVVGVTTLVLAIEGLLYDIIYKQFKTTHNHIGTELFKIALAIVMIVVFKENLVLICVCWAILVALNSTKTLNKSIGHMSKKEPFVFSMIFSIVQLVLAILLIIDPEEHASMHVVLLGVEFIVEAIEFVVNSFYRTKLHKQLAHDDIV